jgi:cysteine desulfurase
MHTEGRMARAALEEARARLAELIGVRSRQVVLTSSGTEAINAAIHGVMATRPGRIALADVEHSAVTAASRRHEIVLVHVDGEGRMKLDHLERVLARGEVALVHCQWANHEVGTRQPLTEVVELVHRHEALVHVDACAAMPTDPVQLGDADLLTFSAHKFGGPAGVGGLILRSGLRLEPFLVGGAQERGRRAGFENVAAAAGAGAAAAALTINRESEATRLRDLRDRLASACLAVDGVTRLGSAGDSLAHILCLGVDGVEAEGVLIGLDQAGVAAHSGSACSSEALEPSPVLQAMGADADHSLRFSLGWNTTDADVAAAGAAFVAAVERLRALDG